MTIATAKLSAPIEPYSPTLRTPATTSNNSFRRALTTYLQGIYSTLTQAPTVDSEWHWEWP